MTVRKGLGQANILRTNNNTSTGYGVAYADEVSGHRTVGRLADLYALHDWQLSASGDNTGSDAIGQLWYVVDADGKNSGAFYQLKDWSKRKEAAGWSIADYTTKAELQDKIDNIATADEEDITTEGDTPQTQVLKLKDRAYDSLNASGKGYKILRKNWQTINGERKNVLTQEMINEPNTIYEIRYDFDLNGGEIKIKEGCVLKFVGGSLSNGTIIGNDSVINSKPIIILKDIIINGVWLVSDIYQSWFNFDLSENADNRNNFKNLIQLTNANITNNVFFTDGTYYTKVYDKEDNTNEALFLLNSNTNLYLNNCTIKTISFKWTHKSIIIIENANNINIYAGKLIGDADTHNYDTAISQTHEWSHGIKIARYSKNITIKYTVIKNFTGDGINIIDSGENETENILIENVTCDSNNREGMSIESGKNITIRKSSFLNTSSIHQTAPGCGFNIEPWIKNCHVENIVLEDCIFKNNYGGIVLQPNKNEENKTSFINNMRVSNCSIGNKLAIYYTNGLSLNNLKFEENSYFKITDSANISMYKSNPEYIEFVNIVDNIVFNKLTVKNRIISSKDSVSNIKIKNSDIELLRVSNINNLLLSDNTINIAEISSKYKTYLLNNSILNMNILATDLAKLINNDIIWNNENSVVVGGTLRNNIIRINKKELKLSDATVINNIVINNNSEIKAAFALNKQGGTFEFIDNKVYGFKSLLVKNIYAQKVKIYSGMPIDTSINYLEEESLEFINGSIDVKDGNQRIYLNNKWININTIDVSAKGRPTNNFLGQQFFDKSLNIPCWWNGTKWVNGNGKIAILDKGNTSNRPSLTQEELGFQYYDTTLKKYIVWNGTEWTNMDGTSLG